MPATTQPAQTIMEDSFWAVFRTLWASFWALPWWVILVLVACFVVAGARAARNP
jgi:hypothetical protein